MADIYLPNKGLIAVVDDDVYSVISRYGWYAKKGLRNKTYYASAWVDGRQVHMHRLIVGLGPGRIPQVDHVNGDGLDNRKVNLRVATASQNAMNRRTNGVKGVSRRPNGRWQADLKMNGRHHYLGVYDTPEEAARAYDTAARQHFGEWARTNG